MGLIVVHPGLFSTVQDRGRPGFRAFGVPPAGASDRRSAALANALLGNDLGAAVVELTLYGGVYEAGSPLALALAGAPMAATVRSEHGPDRPLNVPGSFSLRDGERLALGATPVGARTYLATKGGWRTPVVLGSRSEERPLQPGDVLPCDAGRVPTRRPAPELDVFEAVDVSPVRLVAGPDEARLVGCNIGPSNRFRIGPDSNRMGLRLEGPVWEVSAGPERVSTPVAPGAVQVAGGQPLVLGVACGTMGGYPHVAHVISADLDRIAQARPGDWVRFVRVTTAEARRLDRDDRQGLGAKLARIRAAVNDI